MLTKRPSTLLVALLAAFVFVFLVGGLPFGLFRGAAVDAQYAGPNAVNEEAVCDGKPDYQVRLRGGDVAIYDSSELSNAIAVVKDPAQKKYLLCNGNKDTRPDGYVAILFSDNKRRWVNAGDVISIVPRWWNDSQNP